ncbi:hypothetical protein MY11210_004836 [Beauveria gryllotalpidicola]
MVVTSQPFSLAFCTNSSASGYSMSSLPSVTNTDGSPLIVPFMVGGNPSVLSLQVAQVTVTPVSESIGTFSRRHDEQVRVRHCAVDAQQDEHEAPG